MKNLMINAFGDVVERTDYGNHKNQLNLFDNLKPKQISEAEYWEMKAEVHYGI